MGFFSKVKKKLKKLAKGAAKVYAAPLKVGVDLTNKSIGTVAGKKGAAVVSGVGGAIANVATGGAAGLAFGLGQGTGITHGLLGKPIIVNKPAPPNSPLYDPNKQTIAPTISTPLTPPPSSGSADPEPNFWDQLNAGVGAARGIFDLFGNGGGQAPAPDSVGFEDAQPAVPEPSKLVPFALVGAGLVAVALIARK